MTISKPLDKAPTVDESLRASETQAEEAELELNQLLEEFEDWSENHSGGWKDFLKSKDDSPVRTIKLNEGGPVKKPNDNSLEQLIDDFLDDIRTTGEDGKKMSLTDYIKKNGGVKYE